MRTGPLAFGQSRELSCQVLHRHIMRHKGSVRWRHCLPTRLGAPQLPANFLPPPFHLSYSTADRQFPINRQTCPPVVALDVYVLDAELLHNHRRQLGSEWIIGSQCVPSSITQFGEAFGHFLASRWFVSYRDNDTRRSLRRDGCFC